MTPLQHLHKHCVEQQQEIDRLRAKLELRKTMPMKYRRMEFNAELQKEVERLEAERDALHVAICQAVALMNVGDNRPAHTILREALINYADAVMEKK